MISGPVGLSEGWTPIMTDEPDELADIAAAVEDEVDLEAFTRHVAVIRDRLCALMDAATVVASRAPSDGRSEAFLYTYKYMVRMLWAPDATGLQEWVERWLGNGGDDE